MYRRTGWGWTEGRVARFIRDVEAHFSGAHARRSAAGAPALSALSLACFALMVLEVWVVFWAIGLDGLALAQRDRRDVHSVTSVPGGLIPGKSGRARGLERRGRARARPGRRWFAGAGAPRARAVLGGTRSAPLSEGHAADAFGRVVADAAGSHNRDSGMGVRHGRRSGSSCSPRSIRHFSRSRRSTTS